MDLFAGSATFHPPSKYLADGRKRIWTSSPDKTILLDFTIEPIVVAADSDVIDARPAAHLSHLNILHRRAGQVDGHHPHGIVEGRDLDAELAPKRSGRM